jgi:hypothetical protein
MRVKSFVLLALALALALPAAAQEQRASIEGVIRDAQGGVLPGVTVEARNTASGSAVDTVTSDSGQFRFPSLAPGLYEVTASLSGFQALKYERVELLLGQIKRLEGTLQVAGVTEQVQVTAESPLVDVKQSARATSIRDEQIELLPKGRDFTSLVTQAAGANNESKLGGISIDGASAGENRFIVDGIETTNLQNGTSGKNVIADFIEEVQVKSSGYAAEYGGALGGVINAVTKSGTNSFRGTALFKWESDLLDAGYRPILRRGVLDNSIAEYQTYPEDEYNRFEPGFGIGGPIARDKAWFFGAYQPAFTTTNRVVNPSTSGNPKANSFDIDQKTTVHYFTGNMTAQLSDKIRARVAYNNSWSKREGLLPAQSGTDPVTALFDVDRTFPNWSLSGNLDWVATPSLYFGFRAGYYLSDFYDDGVPDTVRYLYSRGNVGQAGVPSSFQAASGFSNVPTNNAAFEDKQTRMFYQGDATFYVNFAGQHTFKAGVQVDDVGNTVLSGEQQNLVRLQWNASLSGQRGAYGYYQVRSAGPYDPKRGFTTAGEASTTNIGLFIQDAWTIGNRLTINAGLRTEREKVPTYVTGDPTLPEFGVEWDFGDKLAPRLGFAYDINGDGRWKVYGSWGKFYDIFKLELPRGSWGGDRWLEYYYTLDTYDYNTLVSSSGCPPACAGTLIRGPIDFRHVSFGSDYIEPDLKPMTMQEAALGLEHQLSPLFALGVRYVHKQLDKAIEDTGALDANQNEIYVIANPGFGLTAFAHPGVPYPKAVRDYDSLEFTFDKRFASNWSGRLSYMWSRLEGNYSGLSQSDENGRTSPNVGRVFDYPMMMFDENGDAVYGPLPTDRPHQFKAQGIYAFTFGTSVGANLYVASGIPVTREIGIYPPNNLPVQYLGRKSDGRMPTFSQTDMFVQHEFRMSGDNRLQVSLNVLNLFNQDTATNRNVTYQDANGIVPDEDEVYSGNADFDRYIAEQGVKVSPLFLKDSGYQAPLSARFAVKFLF